jgi:two-component system sensor histidine kinase BaeS
VRRHRAASGLSARLFAAQTLVAAVGAMTLWLVTSAIGPTIFHEHLRRVAAGVTPAMSRHVDAAFRSASVISVSVALVGSLTAALVISAYVSRRIARPVIRLAAAAGAVAEGRYAVRVTPPALGPEFSTLTASFNAMAGQLEAVESTRRRLLADLAHEMRTPIATLGAYLDGLEDGVVTVGGDTMTVLRTQTARLSRLAEDISAVSRAEEGQIGLTLQPLVATDLVAAAVSAVADGYSAKGVALITDVTPGLPRLLGDPDRLGQVLGNLLDNALRHTAVGGSVTLRASAPQQSDAIHIDVADTGDGIPGDHLPHIFERFYRVDSARDRAHGGSGIGLAITKALVEAHGGLITAASAGPGQGSLFAMTLPRA